MRLVSREPFTDSIKATYFNADIQLVHTDLLKSVAYSEEMCFRIESWDARRQRYQVTVTDAFDKGRVIVYTESPIDTKQIPMDVFCSEIMWQHEREEMAEAYFHKIAPHCNSLNSMCADIS